MRNRYENTPHVWYTIAHASSNFLLEEENSTTGVARGYTQAFPHVWITKQVFIL
jgi:hypothetical protein